MIHSAAQIIRYTVNSDSVGNFLCPDLAPGVILNVNADLDHLTDFIGDAESCLSPEELVQAEKFRHKRDTNRYKLRRGLLRRLLGHVLQQEPKRLTFTTSPVGKPLVERARNTLDFSVSHTQGLAAYTLSTDHFVGIDIEKRISGFNYAELAHHYFTTSESTWINSLADDNQAAAFLTCWTRKEAFIKLFGPTPLNQIDTLSALSENPAVQSKGIMYFTFVNFKIESDGIGSIAYLPMPLQ